MRRVRNELRSTHDDFLRSMGAISYAYGNAVRIGVLFGPHADPVHETQRAILWEFPR